MRIELLLVENLYLYIAAYNGAKDDNLIKF